MTSQILSTIAKIKQSNPGNLMARHFDGKWFESLGPEDQAHVKKIIASGFENPDSSMGAYAMDPTDYDRFTPLLDPMIADFHGIPAGSKISQPHDWDTDSRDCDLAAIDPALKDVSMRVRVARNVSTFPLPGAMSKDQRIEFENLARNAFEKLARTDGFGGQYLSITPGAPDEISSREYEARVAAHQMFKDMSSDRFLNSAGISSDWPYGRGMYLSANEDFLVWVGEEDHLRIMPMQTGGNLSALFARLRSGLEVLSSLLPDFATSPTYGNITSCPTNLGTGMRTSLHLKLPNLTQNGRDIASLTEKAKTLRLAVRGAGGEHSDAGSDGLVDISPSARLGITEMDIMQQLYDGVKVLWEQETG